MFDWKAFKYSKYDNIKNEVWDVCIVYEKDDDYLYPYHLFSKKSVEPEENYEFRSAVRRDHLIQAIQDLKNPRSYTFNLVIEPQRFINHPLVPQ